MLQWSLLDTEVGPVGATRDGRQRLTAISDIGRSSPGATS